MSGRTSQTIRELILDLKGFRDELFQAEENIRRISQMEEQDADVARRRLADARWNMSKCWLNLPRKLGAGAVRNTALRDALRHMATFSPYPSVANAESAIAMLEDVLPMNETPQAQPGQVSKAPQTLATALCEAMRINGDNKKSAAAKIEITTKTLTNLLHAKNTKAMKRELAQRYIDKTSSRDSK